MRSFLFSLSHSFPYKHGHVCGDSLDLIDGVPTGSVRISFGYMSTLEDVRRFMEFITHCFVEGSPTSNLEWEVIITIIVITMCYNNSRENAVISPA